MNRITAVSGAATAVKRIALGLSVAACIAIAIACGQTAETPQVVDLNNLPTPTWSAPVEAPANAIGVLPTAGQFMFNKVNTACDDGEARYCNEVTLPDGIYEFWHYEGGACWHEGDTKLYPGDRISIHAETGHLTTGCLFIPVD